MLELADIIRRHGPDYRARFHGRLLQTSRFGYLPYSFLPVEWKSTTRTQLLVAAEFNPGLCVGSP